jgi:cytochrome c biogenesis protein ResB
LTIDHGQFFVLHFSLVIILLGGLTTYLTGERGYVHIRQGEIANFFYSEKDAVKHPFSFDCQKVELSFGI